MLTATHKVDFKLGRRTAKTVIEAGRRPELPTPGRLPRITKMMALAIRLDHLIKTGVVKDQAELARLSKVSRARLTQILDLTLLAPDIQEQILHLPSYPMSQELSHGKLAREIARCYSWDQQRTHWKLANNNRGISN